MTLAAEATAINSWEGALIGIGSLAILVILILLYTVLMERRDRLQDAHWRLSAHRIGEYQGPSWDMSPEERADHPHKDHVHLRFPPVRSVVKEMHSDPK